MGLSPAGADTVLELQSGAVQIVIKSKSPLPDQAGAFPCCSQLRVTGMGVSHLKIRGEEMSVEETCYATPPMFFAFGDYALLVRSTDGTPVSAAHNDPGVRDNIHPLTQSGDLLGGVVRFDGSIGFSELEIFCQEEKQLTVSLEVFPSRITYQADYRNILRDISALSGLVPDRILPAFAGFRDALKALPLRRRLLAQLGKKLARRAVRHPDAAIKAPAKIPPESRFASFILKDTMANLEAFRERWLRCAGEPEVLQDLDALLSQLNRLTAALNPEDSGSLPEISSLSPAYRTLYLACQQLQRVLVVHGDVFRLPIRDISQLYGYWCFLKLVSILKETCQLTSSDVIQRESDGVTVALAAGELSQVTFRHPADGKSILLSCRPGKRETVITLEKQGGIPGKFLFLAGYRTDYSGSGPAECDLQTLRCCRDALLFDGDAPERFLFDRDRFGAFVLFPGEAAQETIPNALPFLPGSTEAVETLLSQWLADSVEPAFAPLSPEVEAELVKTDWSVRDVLVGSLGSQAQLEDNLRRAYYYVPARTLPDADLPIRYIALYQSRNLFGEDAGIRYYGRVSRRKPVLRKQIDFPLSRNNPEELYYAFRVEGWQTLPSPMEIRDEGVNGPKFTNLFLLEHSAQSFELFQIHSQGEFRLMTAIRHALSQNGGEYRIDDAHTLAVVDDSFLLMGTGGEILDKVPVSSFHHSPGSAFRQLKGMLPHSTARQEPPL